jgi:hypothetical protein
VEQLRWTTSSWLALLLSLCALTCWAADPATIPFGAKQAGTRDVAAAWYSAPTDRYPHAVLGDDIEGGALVVRTRAGRLLTTELDLSVFEDNTPRLADIDDDGRDEVWVVRSDMLSGARFEAYGIEDDVLVLRYSAQPIGIGFRWLNPIGVADFDGDGEKEVAYIETQHIGGIITILKPRSGQLQAVATQGGYSTHAMGSPHLDLSALADIDHDGATDIVLPTQSRRQLTLVSFTNGVLRERWRSEKLPQVAKGLRVNSTDAGWRFSYQAVDGQNVEVRLLRSALAP